jgi:hypothetical protein
MGEMVFLGEGRVRGPGRPGSMCIFFLTFGPKNLIYESHCDLRIANLVRENQSMKNATKKAKTAKKKAPAKKKK